MGVAKKAVRDWTIRDHMEHWNSLTGLNRQRPSAKKTREMLEVAMMGGRTAHRTLSPKRTPFQLGMVNCPR
jgi:hypothetical protein